MEGKKWLSTNRLIHALLVGVYTEASKSRFTVVSTQNSLFFFTFYLFIFREREREGERERNINVWLPLACPPPGTWPTIQVCPDWESNQQPFGSQA